MTTIEEQIAFVERFKSFASHSVLSLWQEDQRKFSNLIQGFVAVQQKAIDEEMTIASSFNIFSVLKLHFSEVRLHTPILAELLNPKSMHAQGLVIYKHFVQYCLKTNPLPGALDIHADDLYVKDEKVTMWGNIDILLYSRKHNNRFAIIIENKIWAKDQYLQLYRYFMYAKKELGLSADRIRVVYLTVSGKEPSYDGFSENERNTLKQVLVRIGYHSHIVPMLQSAVSSNEIKADNVRHTISQYIQTINGLPL